MAHNSLKPQPNCVPNLILQSFFSECYIRYKKTIVPKIHVGGGGAGSIVSSGSKLECITSRIYKYETVPTDGYVDITYHDLKLTLYNIKKQDIFAFISVDTCQH